MKRLIFCQLILFFTISLFAQNSVIEGDETVSVRCSGMLSDGSIALSGQFSKSINFGGKDFENDNCCFFGVLDPAGKSKFCDTSQLTTVKIGVYGNECFVLGQ